MDNDAKELRQHVRWLEDELRGAAAADNRLDDIDDRLDEINNGLAKLADVVDDILDAIKGRKDQPVKPEPCKILSIVREDGNDGPEIPS